MRVFLLPTLVLFACESSGAPREAAGVRERTNAVKSKVSRDSLVEALCDEQPKTDFRAPRLAAEAPFPSARGWHWINVWATWCKPCVEEMPRLAAWQSQWQREGADVQLSFLSLDEDPAAVEEFASAHPEARNSLRVAEVEEARAWLAGLGVEEMTLPVQLFVDPKGQVQCVRSASVEDGDERAVRALIQ